ncbi:flagella biosynthesis chaperone for FliD FliT [Shewanella sairae]|uniref:Flagella biosynthesis chaperone for FliD FliT n=1 Tax=Shewanella sairae TaxID=190310 RepID=A0ABQ4PPR4_9GAMM|nr:hypothetical protein [Shewanella sairae]MCL1129237.1 hypothetical protein [Shewanella sairae]GIU50850.1 flagella biosynthesis chaperone for FliD FliT [Shewanella sairae]
MPYSSLNQLNEELEVLLDKLNQIPAEDESTDDLVSNLQLLVGKRQFLLTNVFASATAADEDELKKQIMLTRSFEEKAMALKEHRQSLLHVGSKSKRQLNVYKNIDSNR